MYQPGDLHWQALRASEYCIYAGSINGACGTRIPFGSANKGQCALVLTDTVHINILSFAVTVNSVAANLPAHLHGHHSVMITSGTTVTGPSALKWLQCHTERLAA